MVSKTSTKATWPFDGDCASKAQENEPKGCEASHGEPGQGFPAKRVRGAYYPTNWSRMLPICSGVTPIDVA